MKLSCIVVEDEPLAREGLLDYIEQIPYLQCVKACKNASEALAFFEENQCDLLFLDINLPQLSGLSLLKSLTNPPQVIFTTAYREYAIDGFELNAADYLLKPISFDRFYKAVQKVRDSLKASAESGTENKPDYFFIKEDGILQKISFSEILFLEGLKDYFFIHTKDKRHMVLMSLKAAEEALPESEFVRTHRSFIVSKKHIESIEGNQIHIGKQSIPISKHMREAVLQKIVGDQLWKRG